jgi:hypothetical protein
MTTTETASAPTCPKCQEPILNGRPYGRCAHCKEPFSADIDAEMQARIGAGAPPPRGTDRPSQPPQETSSPGGFVFGLHIIAWLGVGLAASLAGIDFVTTTAGAVNISAPQQAALAAQTAAIAIVPYVLARSYDEVFLRRR